MSRSSKTWAHVVKILEAAGEQGATYNDLTKATRLNANSISSQLSTRWHNGELHILNTDWKEMPKRYVLPQFGGTPYIAFKQTADAAREGQALSKPNGEARKPKVRVGRRVSITVTIRINGRSQVVDFDEAMAIYRDLGAILSKVGHEDLQLTSKGVKRESTVDRETEGGGR